MQVEKLALLFFHEELHLDGEQATQEPVYQKKSHRRMRAWMNRSLPRHWSAKT
jgi:hypothetical protein